MTNEIAAHRLEDKRVRGFWGWSAAVRRHLSRGPSSVRWVDRLPISRLPIKAINREMLMSIVGSGLVCGHNFLGDLSERKQSSVVEDRGGGVLVTIQ